MSILTALLALGGLTFLLASLLVLANKKLFVYEDPRIDQVEDLLPKANCGACGLPGCRPFAEDLVAGKVNPGKCTVSSADTRSAIGTLLGVAVGAVTRRTARVACQGAHNVAINKAIYQGPKSCQAAALVSGGEKACSWGCLGYGDCALSCDFGAISMSSQGLPLIDAEKCTACGDCVSVCPKALIAIHKASDQLWVACKNQEQGDSILAACEVACTACGKCAVDAENGAITMAQNLPQIDYNKSQSTDKAIHRCATGAITWYDAKNDRFVKGKSSKKIIRKGARPIGLS